MAWPALRGKYFSGAATNLKECQKEETVHGAEGSEMQCEKGDGQKFSEVAGRMIGLQQGHFQDVIEADHQIFGPVKKDNEGGIPADYYHSGQGSQIGHREQDD